MHKRPQDTSAEEPDGGNPHIRFRGGPGRGDQPGLLNIGVRRLTLALAAVCFMGFTALAVAHHGWSGYQTELLKVDGTIEQSTYANPHGSIHLKTPEKTWLVVLAPTSRMANRGLTAEMLKTGVTVSVEGYQKATDPQEMRAERITVDGKTIELR